MKKYFVLEPEDKFPKSVKDLVIETLLKQPRLNATQITRKINKGRKKEITYRAIYWAIERLLGNKILKKDKLKPRGYYVNPEWIQQLQNILNEVEFEMLKKRKHPLTHLLESTGMQSKVYSHCFPSLRDMEMFIMDLEREEKKSVYSLSKHFWWPCLYPNENRETITKIYQKPKNEIIGVCSFNSPIERYTVSWSKRIGQKTIINSLAPENPHIFVVGDYVLYPHYPKRLLEEIDKKFMSIKSIDDVLLIKDDVLELVEEKDEILLVIVKNIALAHQLQEEVKKWYARAIKR